MAADMVYANGNGIYGTANGSTSAAAAAAAAALSWNPKHLEIKTRSVEKTLEPLVMQVCVLGVERDRPADKSRHCVPESRIISANPPGRRGLTMARLVAPKLFLTTPPRGKVPSFPT